MYNEIKNSYTYEEIFDNLQNSNDDFVKIFSILNLSELNSAQDAHIFINHLTNHSNPLREAIALKLEELYPKYKNYFEDEFSLKKILDAISDINPNICRIICNLIENNRSLEPEIIAKINEVLKDIKNDNKKSHAKNKKLFSLYWLLEGLSVCLSEKYNSSVLEILQFTINFCDYTIREKTAKILCRLKNPPIELINLAKSDQNFYVKKQVYGKMNFED